MDERIRKLFHKHMALLLDKRKNDAVMAATRVRSEENRRGMLRSSRTALRVRSAYEDTYEDICKEAWSNLHLIAVTIGVEPDDTLAQQLSAVFDEVMEPLANRYLSELRADQSIFDSMRDQVVIESEDCFSRSRKEVGVKIELFLVNAGETDSPNGGNTYVQNNRISGTVGAIQQGEYPTATVVQTPNEAALEELRSSLDAFLERFQDHELIAPLATEAKSEAARSEPSIGRLRIIFTGLKACIALIKDGKELFETVESAAQACGMDSLPPVS